LLLAFFPFFVGGGWDWGYFGPGCEACPPLRLAAGLRCERVIVRKAALGGIDTLSTISFCNILILFNKK
jgi:hypothetical protein